MGRGHAASSTDERSAVFVVAGPLGPRGDSRPAFFVVKLGSCSAAALTSSVKSSLAAVMFAVASHQVVESGF